MPIEFPTFKNVVENMRAKVAQELPDSDPTLENSLLNTIITSFGSAISDVYLNMTRLLREAFVQTMSEMFLVQAGEVFGVSRLTANEAQGNVVFNGTIGTLIAEDTQLSSTNGDLYIVDADALVAEEVKTVILLERTGQIAKATFTDPHGIASGIIFTISGADQSEYNGEFTATAISETEIEYTIVGTPVTPATGTIIATLDIVTVFAISVESSGSVNRDSGASFSLSSPIIGIQEPGRADFLGVTGGSDQEDVEDFRARIIFERSGFEALFNDEQIEQQAKTVPGVTRVFVKKITPEVGQVTILFLRDDDPASIIPGAGELEDVKDALILILPATTSEDDVFVQAPTPIDVDFTFTELTPDTPEMRNVIQSNLAAFFIDDVKFETTILSSQFNSVIANSIVLLTGDKVESFTLSEPQITVQTILTLTRVISTAIATFSSPHGLLTGRTVLISGAIEIDYNGLFVITVTSPTTFEYVVSGSPTTPATGNISATINADVIIQENEIGILGDINFSI